MTNTIRNHRNYDADDYAYLNAKGYTDSEILARWNEEAAEGKGPCRWTHHQAQAKLRDTLKG